MPRPKKIPDPIINEDAEPGFATVEQVLLKEDMQKKDPDEELMRVTISRTDPDEAKIPIDVLFGPTNKPFRGKYFDGGTYTVPMKVIKHLDSCQRPEYAWYPREDGKMYKKLIGYTNRFACRQVF